MIAAEHLSKADLVVITFSHLFSIHCNHVVMQPVSCGHFMIADGALCNFTFVVRKLKVHPSSVNIELFTQVFGSHRRTFDMPARETFAPWAFPPHNVLRRRCFPKCKILLVSF